MMGRNKIYKGMTKTAIVAVLAGSLVMPSTAQAADFHFYDGSGVNQGDVVAMLLDDNKLNDLLFNLDKYQYELGGQLYQLNAVLNYVNQNPGVTLTDSTLASKVQAAGLPSEKLPDVSAGEGVYHAGDVAVIQAMYDNNGLKQGDRNDPESWTFATWDNSNPKRITELDLNMGWEFPYDLTGHLDVAGLTNLTKLDCGYNQLQSLDVTNNLNLTELSCGWNALQSLDVTRNLNLTVLGCGYNQLQSLDVTKNLNLTELSCGWNALQSLDVTRNLNLTVLWCSANQLQSLDVTKNPNLTYLNCEINELQSLDVTNNPNLIVLWCGANQLQSLDVMKNPNLTSLWCYVNQLQSLDVTRNLNLEYLSCDGNELQSLDVSNNPQLSDFDYDSFTQVIGWKGSSK